MEMWTDYIPADLLMCTDKKIITVEQQYLVYSIYMCYCVSKFKIKIFFFFILFLNST